MRIRDEATGFDARTSRRVTYHDGLICRCSRIQRKEGNEKELRENYAAEMEGERTSSKLLAFELPLSKSLYALLRLSTIYQDQVSDLSGGSYERPKMQTRNYSKMPVTISTRRGARNATGKDTRTVK